MCFPLDVLSQNIFSAFAVAMCNKLWDMVDCESTAAERRAKLVRALRTVHGGGEFTRVLVKSCVTLKSRVGEPKNSETCDIYQYALGSFKAHTLSQKESLLVPNAGSKNSLVEFCITHVMQISVLKL